MKMALHKEQSSRRAGEFSGSGSRRVHFTLPPDREANPACVMQPNAGANCEPTE